METEGEKKGDDLTIFRGRLGSLSVYEITDYELDKLEEGLPGSIWLNFAILFFSTGASFLTTIVTVPVSDIYEYVTFLVLAVVGLAGSGVFFTAWWRSRSTVRNLCDKIRARMPAPVPAPTPPAATDVGPSPT